MSTPGPNEEPDWKPRRQFRLPPEDEAALDRSGYRWETVLEGKVQWLLIYDWPVPPGYTVNRVSVGLNINPGYPDAQIDMAYFHPDLTPVSGRGIKALSSKSIDGKQWQQWSRHRTKENPWRPGTDDIESHLEQVAHWLRREVGGQERAA